MNQVLEEIVKSGYVKSPNGNLVKLRSAITQEEGAFLTEIITKLKPKVSLEVGLAYGISALYICQAIREYPNARHIIIDPSQNTDWGGLGLYNLKRAGYQEMIDFYEKPSQTVLPQLETLGTKVDFAFIDGWHTFDHTLVDFFFVDKLLRVGGVVAFDDSNWPSINKVIKFIIRNRSYSVVRFLRSPDPPYSPSTSLKSQVVKKLKHTLRHISAFGLDVSSCVALRKEDNDNRRWDYHNNF